MISFTDQQLDKLPEAEKIMYEAYCALEAILGWIDSGKNKSAQSFAEAEHQSRIARLLLHQALDRPCYQNLLGATE